MNRCAQCGGKLTKSKLKNYRYRTPMETITIQGESTVEKCTGCGEVYISGQLIDKWNQEILGKLSEKARLSAEDLQFIFSVLPYSQNEIALATGKDRSTLTKYKNKENPIDPLFTDVIQHIIADYLAGSTDTLQRLKEKTAAPAKEERIVKLKAVG